MGAAAVVMILCTIIYIINNVALAQQRQQQPGGNNPNPLPVNPNPNPLPVQPAGGPVPPLKVGFYEKSCPNAEAIVKEVLGNNMKRDPTLAPAMVRLFFHDCFVNGCDASILIDAQDPEAEVEKDSGVNGPAMRGYELVDAIKVRLEAECPGIVSCADIIAFSNRDALNFTGVPYFPVAAGRRDGRASRSADVEKNIPQPNTPVPEMIAMFQRKGMTLEDMVALTGAHSIGTSRCTSASNRFQDPAKTKDIDRGFFLKMRFFTECRFEVQTIPFDPFSQQKMDSRFYDDVLNNKALLESDHNLGKNPEASNIMKGYLEDEKGWLEKFVAGIDKLGQVDVLTGNQGEIRKQCRAML